MEKVPSFSAAMKTTFGLPGETLKEFQAQMAALDDADRKYFSDEMRKANIPHTDPQPRNLASV